MGEEDRKVVALPGYSVPTQRGVPVPAIVEIMREYLAKAESGELVGVSIAAVCAFNGADERVESDFAIAAGFSWTLSAAIARASRRYDAWIDE